MLIAGVIAAAIMAGLKALNIESPIDEVTVAANIGMFTWWVLDRRKVDKKILKSSNYEVERKFRDPGFWTPWIAILVQVAMSLTAIDIPVYIIPVAGGAIASLFNRKGPRAPK